MKTLLFLSILAFPIPAFLNLAAAEAKPFASLEKNFRETAELGEDFTTIRVPQYPRVKRLRDGGYILLYQSGRFGGKLFCATGTDGLSYSKPTVLFSDKNIRLPNENGKGSFDDKRRYVNPEALVLANGDILAFASYRAVKGYRKHIGEGGIVMRRSTDNGRTWSPEKRIYTGNNWEPSALPLRSGEIQVYFTHIAPSFHLFTYGPKQRNSSGTAIIRSFDNGETWTPDVTEPPYAAHRVMQQYVGKDGKRRLYTDQMPVAVELLNGTIALTGESRMLDEKYHISVARSHDNWAASLAYDEPGPADRDTNLFLGAAPYIAQFPTGETLLTYNGDLDGHRLRFIARLGDENARNFGPARLAINARGYWGSFCIDTPRTALLAFPEILPAEAPASEAGAIHIARFWLNRDITVSQNSTDNTLFIGSDSQAQIFLKFYGDADNLRIRAERRDNFKTDEDALTLRFAGDKKGNDILNLKITAEGLLVGEAPAGISVSALPVEKPRVSVLEIKIPRALLSVGKNNTLRIYPILHNRDTGRGRTLNDTLTGADPARPATWPAIRFAAGTETARTVEIHPGSAGFQPALFEAARADWQAGSLRYQTHLAATKLRRPNVAQIAKSATRQRPSVFERRQLVGQTGGSAVCRFGNLRHTQTHACVIPGATTSASSSNVTKPADKLPPHFQTHFFL